MDYRSQTVDTPVTFSDWSLYSHLFSYAQMAHAVLSKPLVCRQMARSRVDAAGLSDIVTIMHQVTHQFTLAHRALEVTKRTRCSSIVRQGFLSLRNASGSASKPSVFVFCCRRCMPSRHLTVLYFVIFRHSSPPPSTNMIFMYTPFGHFPGFHRS